MNLSSYYYGFISLLTQTFKSVETVSVLFPIFNLTQPPKVLDDAVVVCLFELKSLRS